MKNFLSTYPGGREIFRRRREASRALNALGRAELPLCPFLKNRDILRGATASGKMRISLGVAHLSEDGAAEHRRPTIINGSRPCRAFSLLEILVVVGLLSVIVLALMSVFSNTQRAFRSVMTQTDVLQGGRSTMELMSADLRGLTPSYGTFALANSPVNFFVLSNTNYDYNYFPLLQTLPGSAALRTNALNYFFMLGRENTRWIGIGYVVDTTNTSTLYPLYRYYRNDLDVRSSPYLLYTNFIYTVANGNFDNQPNMSRVVDGVVHMVVRPYDTNGTWICNLPKPYTNILNTWFYPSNAVYGESQLFMYSNAVPASIELELGVIEDRVVQHAEALPTSILQSNYLSGQSGALHLFRQRVAIPTIDPTAY